MIHILILSFQHTFIIFAQIILGVSFFSLWLLFSMKWRQRSRELSVTVDNFGCTYEHKINTRMTCIKPMIMKPNLLDT